MLLGADAMDRPGILHWQKGLQITGRSNLLLQGDTALC